MKKRHETRKGIVYKNRHHAELLADEIKVEEALTEALNLDWHRPEINWDELAEIAEMQNFAERGLSIF